MIIPDILLWLSALYLSFGLLFAIFFVSKGVHKIDEGAHGSRIGFRIIIIPGTTVFWPLLLKKWLHAIKKGKDDKIVEK